MWSPPYGHIATQIIEANSVISPHMTTSPGRQTVVKRNENVIVRIEMPGLLITAVGKALQDGKTGDSIRVRNTDSRMIIWARVNENGTLCPIY
jgi:flagella basal body P-ring formation protein FlgA